MPPLDATFVGLRLAIVIDAHEQQVMGMLGHTGASIILTMSASFGLRLGIQT